MEVRAAIAILAHGSAGGSSAQDGWRSVGRMGEDEVASGPSATDAVSHSERVLVSVRRRTCLSHSGADVSRAEGVTVRACSIPSHAHPFRRPLHLR